MTKKIYIPDEDRIAQLIFIAEELKSFLGKSYNKDYNETGPCKAIIRFMSVLEDGIADLRYELDEILDEQCENSKGHLKSLPIPNWQANEIIRSMEH